MELAARARRRCRRELGIELVLHGRPRRTGCAAPRALDLGPAALAVRLRARPRDARSARSSPPRRPTTSVIARVRGRSRPTPGSTPRTGAARSRPRRAAIAAMELGPARRGDDRERRRDRGRQRLQRRRRALPGRRARPAVSTRRRRVPRQQAIVDACTWAASEGGCDVDVEVTEMFRGYQAALRGPRGPGGARARCERCGIEPREVATGGGSDANALLAARLRLRAARQRDERQRTRPRRASPATRLRRDARGLRGDRDGGGRRSAARRGLMLKLRAGVVVSARPAAGRGRRRTPGRPGPTSHRRAGRGGRRGGRQRRGARPRARLGRLRHRPRQPHPRPRGRRGRGRRARDEAQLQLAPAPGRPGRGRGRRIPGRRRRCRYSSFTCTGISRRLLGRPPRRSRDCGSASSRRPAARCRGPLARRARAARVGSALRPHHRGRLPTAASTRRSASSAGSTPPPGARVGRGRRRPGPGILGSATRLGHGGMAALDTAHAALALGLPTLFGPRLSSSDPRPRHRGSQPPHANGAGAAAGAGPGPGAGDRERGLAAAAGASSRAGRRRRRALDALIEICTRGRHDLAVGGSTSTATRRAGCRRRRWAGRIARTRCSSPRAGGGAWRWPRRSRVGEAE